MDSVCIGTKARRFYVNGVDMNSLATVESEVELRAICDFKSVDSQIGAHEEPYCLKSIECDVK